MNNYQLIAAQQKAAQLLADLNRAQARILELEEQNKTRDYCQPSEQYQRGFIAGCDAVYALQHGKA